MPRLIVNEFVTLDGVMQAPGSPDEDRSGGFDQGGWQLPYFDDTFGQAMTHLFNEAGGLLLGRKTYDIFAAYWPNQPDDDPLARTMNGLTKHVVSHTLNEPLAWQNSRLIGADVAAEIARLKGGEEGPLLVIGSGELVTFLAANDLVDEYRLAVHPLIVGKGKRLFREPGSQARLRLVDSTPTTTGVLLLTYVPGSGKD
jgi:dihydrofolate reductase